MSERIPTDELIKNLEILFNYDDYEEICYPIIRTYFMYSIGKMREMDNYDIKTLRLALNILGIE